MGATRCCRAPTSRPKRRVAKRFALALVWRSDCAEKYRNMANLVGDMPQTIPAGEAAAQESKPAPVRRSRARWIIAIVLVVLIAVGVAFYLHFQDRVSSDDANVDGHVVAIAPKIAGNVTEVLIRDNQSVK